MQKTTKITVICMILACGFLYIQHLVRSQQGSTTLIPIVNADWQYEGPQGHASRSVPMGLSLAVVNSDLPDCCTGTYEFEIPIDAIASKEQLGSQQLLALYFPAIGGQYSIAIDGKIFPYSGSNSSNLGPIVPLDTTELSHNPIISVKMQGPKSGFAGIWRGKPLLGRFDILEQQRQADFLFNVILPFFFVCISVVLSLFFFYLYAFTGKHFPVYRLISFSLILIASFQLMLSGFPRKFDLLIASAAHYPFRLLEAVGVFVLLKCFVTHINGDVGRKDLSQKDSSAIVIPLLICAAVVLFIVGVSGFWTQINFISTILYLFAFLPLLTLPLNKISFKSVDFIGIVIIATFFISSILDAIKLIARVQNIFLPYEYFTRFNTPIFVSTTVIIFAKHFRDIYHDYIENQKSAAEDAALVRTAQMIAHDVRKPFKLIKNGLISVRQQSLPERITSFFNDLSNQIETSLESVESMLADLLAVGSTQLIEKKLLNPADLIEEAMGLVDSTTGEREFRMKMTHTQYISGDRAKLIRVFSNLLENAFQAAPYRGLIEVTVEDSSFSQIRVIVRNSGSYIEKEDIEKLFQPFFTKNKMNGTGLGLTICKKIVQAHDGEIWCQSSESDGTSFFVTLPVVKQSNLGAELPRSDNVEECIIAVIDDDILLLDESSTRFAPFKVKTFSSPKQFWMAYEQGLLDDICCVVTDFVFDGDEMTGLVLAQELSLKKANLPIFLCSNFPIKETDGLIFKAILPKDEQLGEQIQEILSVTK